MRETNHNGEYIECAMRKQLKTGRGKCSAMVGWYNGKNAVQDRCVGCPFYKSKTAEQKQRIRCLHRLSRLGLIDIVTESYPLSKKWIAEARQLVQNIDM